jgi:hypothetical protein
MMAGALAQNRSTRPRAQTPRKAPIISVTKAWSSAYGSYDMNLRRIATDVRQHEETAQADDP